MLYTPDSSVFAIGMFLCLLFGGVRPGKPSVDFVLFIWTATVSKQLESLPDPQEFKFDAHILSLEIVYLITGDKHRSMLLAAWLPYIYMADDHVKCAAYLSLAAVVALWPQLWRAYQVVWLTVSAVLYNNIKQGFRCWCLFAIKTIESITPCPPLSHISAPPPPPAPPTLSLSGIITTADISPVEIQKSAMIDSNTQETPPSRTSTGTQCEEGRRDETICSQCSGSSIYTKYIVTGNAIMRVRPHDDKLPSLSEYELARLQNQMQGPTILKSAPKVSVPVLSHPISPPTLPIKPDKSVKFGPVPLPAKLDPVPLLAKPKAKPKKYVRSALKSSPASPVALPESTVSSSSAIIEPNPVLPCLVPDSRPASSSVAASLDISSAPALAPALAPHELIPEPISAPVVVPDHAVKLESSEVAAKNDSVSPTAPVIETQPSGLFAPLVFDYLATSHPNVPVVASEDDEMEVDIENVDIENVDENPIVSLADNLINTQSEEAEPTFDPDQFLQSLGLERDLGLGDEFRLTSEELERLWRETLSADYTEFPSFNDITTETEADNSLKTFASTIPFSEDFSLFHNLFVPTIGEQMQNVAQDVTPIANESDNVVMIDVEPVPPFECPEVAMSAPPDVPMTTVADLPPVYTFETVVSSEANDEDEQMSDADASRDTDLHTAPSMPIDEDMDENTDLFDMSPLLSSLPPTPEVAPCDSAVDEEMSEIGSVHGSMQTLFAPLPTTVTTDSNISNPSVHNADDAIMEDRREPSAANQYSGSGPIASVTASTDASVSLAEPAMFRFDAPVFGAASARIAVPSAAISPVPPVPPIPPPPPTNSRPMVAAKSISSRLPPSTPRPTPAEPPIALNSQRHQSSIRVLSSLPPPKLTYNIQALQPDYRPARKLTLAPRPKEVYVDFEGYPQKTRWADRGAPPFDDDADDTLVMIEQRMEFAEEEARRDWPSRKAGIEEQTKLDLAAKKARDKKIVEAKHAAKRAAAAAASKNPPKKKKKEKLQ
ncbi:hypothetical protein F4678DRAFT_465737 [Xylaria arbuscula]|nr:hypothetical protein F4678DRAFT_465737 [Xylaria arbuscula]